MQNLKSEKLKGFLRNWGWWSVKMVLVLTCIYFVFGVLLTVGMCRGTSMENTLYSGDILVFHKLGYEPKFGDIVLIRSPNTDEKILVKRIIGLPGDTLEFYTDAGEVYRNGALLNEPYLGSQTHLAGSIVGPVVVEDGHYFVMGDNRMDSLDSRYKAVGQIPRENILGGLLKKEDWRQ